MPNHTANLLEVSGDDAADILDSLGKGETLVDFNTVIPMPDQLDLGSAPVLRETETEESLQALLDDPAQKWQKDAIQTKLKMLKNKQELGYASWYDWSCENWGTKWNAYDCERQNDDSIYFETAWSPPLPVIKALSARHPENTFVLSYADEGGGFLGWAKIAGGAILEEEELDWCSEEGIALRQRLGRWDEDEDEDWED